MKVANPVRRKLSEGGVILCGMLRLPNPAAAEIMAASGIEMICIDNEHYPFNPETVEKIARAGQIHGASVFIRIPNKDPATIAQMLDCGVQGIKIPHVDTKEEAQAVVDAVKYAPVGRRGFCPITRGAAYGYELSPADFTVDANRETLIAIMVETKTGLENMDEILTVDGIDIIAIGPSDVSASYGLPGQPDHPVVKAAIDEASKKVIASGRQLCTLVKNEQQAWEALEMGARIFQIGSELQMLTGGFSALVREVKESVGTAEKE